MVNRQSLIVNRQWGMVNRQINAPDIHITINKTDI